MIKRLSGWHRQAQAWAKPAVHRAEVVGTTSSEGYLVTTLHSSSFRYE